MMDRGYGRARSQNEYLPKHEDRERRSGWGVAPPSCSLWVGSLSSHVTHNALSEQFLKFGDLENIAFVPGRNYAFVNYKKVEDAIIAMRGLQGFNLGGMPIRIEFAKGAKSSMLPHDEERLDYDNSRQTMEQGDSLSRRDLRPVRPSPEKSYEKSKGGGGSSSSSKTTDPSEMLWIGFPSFMNVDEVVLRRAFSPFGEIDKISTFPGRTYAFVRFKTILSACRAKEALQGKLFNNPRVNICFARNENSTEHSRGLLGNYPLSRSEQGVVESFQRERSFESPFRGEFRMASPGFTSNFSGRNSSARSEPNFSGAFDEVKVQEIGSKRRMMDDSYHIDSPAPDKPAPWLDFSFEKTRTQRAPPPYEDSWGLENGSFATAKKMRTDPLPDNELPEYPFSDFEQGKRSYNPVIPKIYSDLPEQPSYSKSFHVKASGFRGLPESSRNIESNDPWRKFDGPSAPPVLSTQKFNSEPQQPPVNNKEWKWEGIIAKGGTTVCRARCFPVGKVLDFTLPDILDCTARTGLDMLSRHYYQAASTWVVFFVPESDADINFYNEFMHYLGEKQRAAVVKLGEKVSLFLVPPSDFSEQVLKVPGKVSISGVILKFQHPSSSFSSLNNQMEVMESKLASIIPTYNNETSIYGDSSFTKQRSPDYIKPFSQNESFFGSSSRHASLLPPSFPPPNKIVDSNFYDENRHDQLSQIPNASSIAAFPPAVSHSFDNSKVEEYAPIITRAPQSQPMNSSNYNPEVSNIIPTRASNFNQQNQEIKPQLPLQPEQLAHLATILGQQKQLANPNSLADINKKSILPQNPSSQTHTSFPNPEAPRVPQALVGPQVPTVSTVQHLVGNQVQHSSSQQASNSNKEETEADPQKRLQATLQLAAALLQQIQQQAKP